VPLLRRFVAGFPPRRSGFYPRSGYMGFMVDKVALGQVFSEYFSFPYEFLFHRLLHNRHHLSSEAGTTGQIVAAVPSVLSLTPPLRNKKNKYPWANYCPLASHGAEGVAPVALRCVVIQSCSGDDGIFNRTSKMGHDVLGLHDSRLTARTNVASIRNKHNTNCALYLPCHPLNNNIPADLSHQR
jgi:hypothetical protein